MWNMPIGTQIIIGIFARYYFILDRISIMLNFLIVLVSIFWNIHIFNLTFNQDKQNCNYKINI